MPNSHIRIEMTIDGRTAVGEVEIDDLLLNIWPGAAFDEMSRVGRVLCDRLVTLHKDTTHADRS